jgi:hypothetical protein
VSATRAGTLLLFIGLVCSGCLSGSPTALHLQPQQAVAEWSIETTRQASRVTIDCPRGVGRARLLRVGSDWPPSVVISLRLRALEGFTLSGGNLLARTALARHGESLPWEIRQLGDNSRSPVELTSFPAAITRSDGLIHVYIPSGWLTADREYIDLQWVDHYR